MIVLPFARPYEPMLIVMDATPDGFTECILELNGREVGRTVLRPLTRGTQSWALLTVDYERFDAWWKDELKRKC